jgi:Protein of unknown function (DUF4239)
MQPTAISLIAFALIIAGALSGFYLATVLPEQHLNHDSREAVKMGWGILATMSALVLSLLVSSAKNTFDVVNSESIENAAQIIILNHALMQYGPDANTVRNDLKTSVAAYIKRDWPAVAIASSVPAAPRNSNLMEGMHDEITKLKPASDVQRAMQAQAESASNTLSKGRWLIVEQNKISLPPALLIVLVFWLALLFFGLGLLSPHNHTVLAMLILCSLSVSIAIFLITDLSHPLRGVVQISSGPMLDAFERINRL